MIASRGKVDIVWMVIIVVAMAIIGDNVGYPVGRHFGPRVLQVKFLARHQARIEKAQDFLRRRGGSAVFYGAASYKRLEAALGQGMVILVAAVVVVALVVWQVRKRSAQVLPR